MIHHPAFETGILILNHLQGSRGNRCDGLRCNLKIFGWPDCSCHRLQKWLALLWYLTPWPAWMSTHVIGKQVLLDRGRFVARNENDDGLWRLRSFALFGSPVRVAIHWCARPNEVARVMRGLQFRCGKIMFFCPMMDEGKVIRPPPLSPTHPPTALMSSSGLAEKVGVTPYDHTLGVYWKLIH